METKIYRIYRPQICVTATIGHLQRKKVKVSAFFCRAMLCISAAIAVMRCPSVRLSVRLSVCHVRGSCQNE